MAIQTVYTYQDGELIETKEIEVPDPPLAETLETMFLQGIQQLGNVLTVSERGKLFGLKAAVVEALKFDIEAAKAIIEDAPLPDNQQVNAIRAAMLEKFPHGQ